MRSRDYQKPQQFWSMTIYVAVYFFVDGITGVIFFYSERRSFICIFLGCCGASKSSSSKLNQHLLVDIQLEREGFIEALSFFAKVTCRFDREIPGGGGGEGNYLFYFDLLKEEERVKTLTLMVEEERIKTLTLVVEEVVFQELAWQMALIALDEAEVEVVEVHYFHNWQKIQN